MIQYSIFHGDVPVAMNRWEWYIRPRESEVIAYGHKVVFGAVVLLIGGFLGWYVYSNGISGGVKTDTYMAKAPVPTEAFAKETVREAAESQEAKGGTGGISTGTTVMYKDAGFSPKELRVKKGTTVVFINNSTKSMWVASAPHPSHTILPEFDELKSVQNGGQYVFTFEKVGIWKYHNHVNPSDFGNVMVTE
jgi:plastocyanin